MKKTTGLLLAQLLFAAINPAVSQDDFGSGSGRKLISNRLAVLPLAFTENRGQFGDRTLYKAQTGGAAFYFCHNEAVYLFVRDTDIPIEENYEPYPSRRNSVHRFRRPAYKQERSMVRVGFLGASPDVEIIGEGRLPYNNNYFRGNDPDGWHADIPNYSSVMYRNIYPGIDLRYYGNGRSMKYDFIINPGADISCIQIRYQGADSLKITPNGDLEAVSSLGRIHENTPFIYQEVDNTRKKVAGGYRLISPGVFGFEIHETFNASYPLVIDPELVYSTYLGGNRRENGTGVFIDDRGNVYVSGHTCSADFPTENPYDDSYNGGTNGGDFFVCKLDPSGESLLYSTYIGGLGEDYEPAIAVDSYGNAYLTGYTISPDFPVVNAYDDSYNLNWDAVVVKLSTGGNSLIYSTYIGGSDADYGYSITVDNWDNVFITGKTVSYDFPVVNPYDDSFNGGRLGDAFITKFSSTGESLIYSTYFGGSDHDCGYDIAVSDMGKAVIGGSTTSDDLPMQNSYDYIFNGGADAFIAIFSVAGDILEYSTYFGGSGSDHCLGLDIDPKGIVYITGDCWSPDLPVVNAYQDYLNGALDAFITKLSTTDNSLLFSTYLGGSYWDFAYDLAVDESGNVFVTGCTMSSDFPTVNPFDPSYNGNEDCWTSIFSSEGYRPIYSTYLGGSGRDWGTRISLNAIGEFCITGYTSSSDFPIINPYDGTYGAGSSDAFVAKFGGVTGMEETIQVPAEPEMFTGYPNPFNTKINLSYCLIEPDFVILSIHNILGRQVVILHEGNQPQGNHRITWNASSLSSGVYFARLKTGDRSKSIKLVVMK